MEFCAAFTAIWWTCSCHVSHTLADPLGSKRRITFFEREDLRLLVLMVREAR